MISLLASAVLLASAPAQADPRLSLVMEPFPGFGSIMKSQGFVLSPVTLRTSWTRGDQTLRIAIDPTADNRRSDLFANETEITDPRLERLAAKAWASGGGRLFGKLNLGGQTATVDLTGPETATAMSRLVKVEDKDLPKLPNREWRTLKMSVEVSPNALDVLAEALGHIAATLYKPNGVEEVQLMDGFLAKRGFERSKSKADPLTGRKTPKWSKGDYSVWLGFRDKAAYAEAMKGMRSAFPARSAAPVRVEIPDLERLGIKVVCWGGPRNLHAEFEAGGKIYDLGMSWPIASKHGEWSPPKSGIPKFDRATLDLFTTLGKAVKARAR